jgi:hypothetical protein
MAKQQPVGKTPTVGLQPTPTVHVHQPAKTIAGAIKAANAHVQAVNKSSRA